MTVNQTTLPRSKRSSMEPECDWQKNRVRPPVATITSSPRSSPQAPRLGLPDVTKFLADRLAVSARDKFGVGNPFPFNLCHVVSLAGVAVIFSGSSIVHVLEST